MIAIRPLLPLPILLAVWLAPLSHAEATDSADQRFAALAAAFLDEMPALSPVGATAMGDHRFDAELDDVSAAGRERSAAFLRDYRQRLDAIPRDQLSRANQVDHALLAHHLESSLWELETVREWAWNPLVYSGLAGGAIHSLLAREFAPLDERLEHVAARLEMLPRLLAQAREALDPAAVPKVHAETAANQNRGIHSILSTMVEPHVDTLPEASRQRLRAAIALASKAADEHQTWLDETLVPQAAGDFRAGAERYDRRLAYALNTPLDRAGLKARAEAEYQRIRDAMYAVSTTIYRDQYPLADLPEEADETVRQLVIRAALEVAYRDLLDRDAILETARAQIEQATAFVREHDLVGVPDDPVEVIVMPEFARGVSIAYCDSPGPLDTGQKTFYAISPIPDGWTEEQVLSFLREYNTYSLQNLTIHEAVPGHYLQLAHSGRYPSTLRAVLQSGTFIEGWAVYAEQFMVEAGYNDGDPRQKLIALKWLLRAVTNALIDQAIHVDGMTRDEAMHLMVEGGFQEEREAALKWTRAQLGFTQLSTYLVGYLEHADLRREVEAARGDAFEVRAYHDELLSYGSPPVQFVRALMLDLPIPE